MSDWKYDLDEVGEDADDEHERETLEPGSPSLENAVFVLLGVFVTLFVFFQLIALA